MRPAALQKIRPRILQCPMPSRSSAATAAFLIALIFSALSCGRPQQAVSSGGSIPRTADGKPNFQGIWQVRNRAAYDLLDYAARHEMPAGQSVVEGGEIPYQ